MPRGKRVPEGSSYSYFKKLFTNRPELLKEKKNADILACYRADHGLAEDALVEKKVVNNMSNLKSNMRKHLRQRASSKAAAAGVAVTRSSNKLELLEEKIDDCLTMVCVLDREGLDEVIHHLRRARNKVVWKHGEN